MPALCLYIGNKNYSSWSFRPWIAMRQAGIEFDEHLSPFDEANHNRHFFEFSAVGRVPVLSHGDLRIWESLAILEYVAELFPAADLWPKDQASRAQARTISHEMHAGFAALRRECPMNMRRPISALKVTDQARKDIARIAEIWQQALAKSGGPFLFGAFSIADAMYAPVVNRFHVYDLTPDKTAQAYMSAMMALPAYAEWAASARDEPWVVEEEEV